MSDRIGRILGPAGPELTCEQCFEMVDLYVDATVDGHDAEAAVPGMRAHLSGCPACHEDYESLLALVESERQT